MSVINERIKMLRMYKKKSVEEMAAGIGVTTKKYLKWENDGRLKADDIVQICEAENVSADYLSGRIVITLPPITEDLYPLYETLVGKSEDEQLEFMNRIVEEVERNGLD